MKNFNYLIMVLLVSLSSCKDYLDVKPDKKLVVPSTLGDAQSILNHFLFNTNYPFAGEVGSDDFLLKTEDWLAANTVAERNAYIWSDDVFNEYARNDWSLTYEKIYYANLVIEGISQGTINGNLADVKNDILGQALFFRANSYFQLLQIFAPQWDSATSSSDLGIPLRNTADFNARFKRSSVEQSYQQIVEDLELAASLLNTHSQVKTRPNKQAAYSLLARIYLAKEQYENALKYADLAIGIGTVLIDYNKLNTELAFPFPIFNEEVIWHSSINTPRIFYAPVLKVSPEIRKLYTADDLRPSLFFMKNSDSTFSFKGSYNGSFVLFNGLAYDELYLIKAECLARLNKNNEALETLTHLTQKRFTPQNLNLSEKVDDILTHILQERRKELLFRGLRWGDLRRLNKDPKFAVTIRREVNGQNYILKPGDKKYIFKIPLDVIELSGIEQN